MKPVFFDSIGRPTARSSFPAKTPAQLIDCYLVFAIVRGTAQFEGRRNCGASAADDGNFDRLLFGQTISSRNRILAMQPNETSNMRANTSTAMMQVCDRHIILCRRLA
jgi:hypothetical protein